MSPAGSGGAQYRDGLRPALKRPVSICAWLRPWLLPAGLLGAVAFVALPGVFGYFAVGIWGWLVFPYVAAFIHDHARGNAVRNAGSGFGEGDSQYWRTRLM
jgi:hypothetical protein